MRTKKSLALLLIAALVFLLVACGSKEKKHEVKVEEVKDIVVPAFKIKVCGVKITNEDMAAYPLYKATANTVNSQGTAHSEEFIGYKFSDVLTACGITGAEGKLTVTCSDGYELEYGGDILAESVLIAVSKSGKLCKDGPWFAPCASGTTGDFAQDVSGIEIEKADVPESKNGSGDGGEVTELKAPDKQDKTGKVELAPFCFLVNDTEVTNDTLKDLSFYKIKVTVKNSKGNVSERTYGGYLLCDVLKALGLENAVSVTAVASDGKDKELTAEQIASEFTLIAIELDKETGEDGTVWLAPCEETSSGEYAKLVVQIKAE